MQLNQKELKFYHSSNLCDDSLDKAIKYVSNKKVETYILKINNDLAGYFELVIHDNIQEIEITELDRISTIEKAVHNQNYPEKDLFQIYKRFQFNINQLLSVKQSYKLLENSEARALVYQGILITNEIDFKTIG